MVHSHEYLWGQADIHTHAYSHRGQKQFQETSCVPAFGWHTPGLKIKSTQ